MKIVAIMPIKLKKEWCLGKNTRILGKNRYFSMNWIT